MTRLRLIVVLFTVLLLNATAQFNLKGGNLALKGFTLQGFDADGNQWQLMGQRTTSNGFHVNIEDFTLDYTVKQGSKGDTKNSPFPETTNQNGVQLLLKSDRCVLNSSTKEIKSDAPVKIRFGSNVMMTGIGYDVDVDKKVILIRSAVDMTVKLKKSTKTYNLHKGTYK